MKKFQKIQGFFSIIPAWSTFFIAIVTMVVLKRNNASRKLWIYFMLTFFLFGLLAYFVNTFIMTGQHIVLNIIVSGLILAVANSLFIGFQVTSTRNQTNESKTKFDKKIVVYCIAVGMVVIGIVVLRLVSLSPSVAIEDINGCEDTSLAVIDIYDILSNANNFSAFKSYASQSGEQTGVAGKMKQYDYDVVTFRCEKISGIKTLQVTKAIQNQVVLEIDSQLDAGNMEIAIIVDGEYYDSVVANKGSSIVLTGIKGKIIIVRIAAESARADVSITRKFN